MNRRLLFYICILAALLTLPYMAIAQEEEPELICEAFPDAATDVRTSYYMREGAAFFSSGQLVRAIDSFSCVVEQINGNYIDAYTSRAIVYTTRRDYDKAIEDYTQLSNSTRLCWQPITIGALSMLPSSSMTRH